MKNRFNNHFDDIIDTSIKYLKKVLNDKEYDDLIKKLSKKNPRSQEDCIKIFNDIYQDIIKHKYQAEYI